MPKNYSKYFIISFFSISCLSFVFLLLLDYLVAVFEPTFPSRLGFFAIFSILLAAILTFCLSVLSPILNEAIMTLQKMLKIESLSSPLLTRLSSEAPGTYHHSLNVSTLAQKAAKAIGANSLLVSTAGYYHDIGKLENPTAFMENQAGIEIPTNEDADSIRKNAEAIISHVEKGIKIAEAHELPSEIIDLIKEHHGTTRALYFFQKAKEHGLKIKRTDFRYSGPKPQSKESAILMLADCVEATARALTEVNEEKINFLVQNSIKERMEDKQFKAVNLSEKELLLIAQSLEKTLLSIYHQRMVYKDGQFDNRK